MSSQLVDIWKNTSDEKLLAAMRQLDTYEEHARDVIRDEFYARGLSTEAPEIVEPDEWPDDITEDVPISVAENVHRYVFPKGPVILVRRYYDCIHWSPCQRSCCIVQSVGTDVPQRYPATSDQGKVASHWHRSLCDTGCCVVDRRCSEFGSGVSFLTHADDLSLSMATRKERIFDVIFPRCSTL